MNQTISKRKLAISAGISYIIVFFAAIFANFFVLEAIKQNPLQTITQHHTLVGFGILAFLITIICDIIVAWALYELFKNHSLSKLSTYFRMTHAMVFAVAIFALPLALTLTTNEAILQQVHIFEIIWLIGLFFFGVHLILLGIILKQPKWIAILLVLAGIMYMVDTCAHFMLANYNDYAAIFLTLVMIPSIIGEMSFTIWLLVKGGREK